MGGNTFYSNAEAYAFEILHQKMIKEAQRSAQQMMMELSALKSFVAQGQLLYCIPIGGGGFQSPFMPLPFYPFPTFPSLDPPFPPPDPHHHPLPPPTPSPCAPIVASPSSPPPPANQQSVLNVNLKNTQGKTAIKAGSDECNLGKDGIEVTIDLREYLPAEITLDVEEKSIEIKARHVDPQGSKTFARRYDLPACIILDSVKCFLSHDGYLMFSAGWVKME